MKCIKLAFTVGNKKGSYSSAKMSPSVPRINNESPYTTISYNYNIHTFILVL